MLTVNFHTTEDTSLTLCTSDRQDLNLAAGAVSEGNCATIVGIGRIVSWGAQGFLEGGQNG